MACVPIKSRSDLRPRAQSVHRPDRQRTTSPSSRSATYRPIGGALIVHRLGREGLVVRADAGAHLSGHTYSGGVVGAGERDQLGTATRAGGRLGRRRADRWVRGQGQRPDLRDLIVVRRLDYALPLGSSKASPPSAPPGPGLRPHSLQEPWIGTWTPIGEALARLGADLLPVAPIAFAAVALVLLATLRR